MASLPTLPSSPSRQVNFKLALTVAVLGALQLSLCLAAPSPWKAPVVHSVGVVAQPQPVHTVGVVAHAQPVHTVGVVAHAQPLHAVGVVTHAQPVHAVGVVGVGGFDHDDDGFGGDDDDFGHVVVTKQVW
ncbi:uncharacterized protein LOC122243271 isoform X4 [Penaeus japonicus]|uniref:uncharacterized protein LOC122243271 isoform X4 n=1 Tax=Penaeus japonicus TaxID=27405 RepID=UPI001C71521A|nr:uncharacterized protein LOC122243271 isoform X4 [Penaeus japonicus]